jgi:dipeptidyl aminopeptidase/acylaminoacyl peptidase
VRSPTDPGAYYVFDRQAGTMTLVAERHPDLSADRLAPMETFKYRARDGMLIPAYVTRPPGAVAGKPLPLIVMPHGGPEARDSLDFDIWAEFFATRGYLVLQPNFRGSAGYGRKYAEAGYGQWGGKMDDDITDGVLQLIKSGRVDKNRICIFGASFGGYAALYGGAKTPELYKCIASFAGVSDLNALVNWEHATKGHEGRYHYAARSIGDPTKDSARLAAASPITYAASYKPPVLLIHGADDASVPVIQSKMMQAALQKAGKDVRLVIYPHEGHTDWTPTDEQAALTEIAAFIESHIDPVQTGAAKPAT